MSRRGDTTIRRPRRQAWLKAFIWVFLAIFIFSAVGVAIALR